MAPQVEDELPSEERTGRSISFHINEEQYTITADVSPHTVLADFIRDHVRAKGTKILCREGGCGTCMVVATVPDVAGGNAATRTFSVQACQVLVYGCSGWSIETIESLGNRHVGYHDLQKSLVGFYGTQCGYCSPGMIMTMHGELRRTGGHLTVRQVEESLDGNICRCTGYRPILDAFKALAVDGAPRLKQQLLDIEDAYKGKCPNSGGECKQECGGSNGSCPNSKHSTLETSPGLAHSRDAVLDISNAVPDTTESTPDTNEGIPDISDDVSDIKDEKAASLIADVAVYAGRVQWFQPTTLRGLFNVLRRSRPEGATLLVAGNTAAGVYKDDGPYSRYISLDSIATLQMVSARAARVTIGGRVSMTRCIEVFRKVASSDAAEALPGYRHLAEVADHWQLVANLGVRNSGSWAGNLIMKAQHPEFPSDLFVTLAACDAKLVIGNADTRGVSRVSVADVLKIDWSKKVILSMVILPLPEKTCFRTFKISPRTVNSHAYVNAALRLPVDPSDEYRVTTKPGLFFGGLGPHFISASQTESLLEGQQLGKASVVEEAVKQLVAEVVAAPQLHQGSVQYRQSLVAALFYKTVSWMLRERLPPRLRLTGESLQRSIGSSQQQFDANTDTWPVGQPIPKVESNVQVSGEAVYADDIQPSVGELQGVFVQTQIANAKIDSIDASAALAMPGVVAFVSAADIRGLNSFMPPSATGADKVFATERSQYAGQSLGLVLADTRDVAVAAAKLVRVAYSDKKKPILTIRDALKDVRNEENLKANKANETNIMEGGDVKECLESSKHRVTGDIDIGTQFHLQMEPMHACVVPMEDGYNVTCTTQHINMTQSSIAEVLDVSANSINMEVRRLGGAFGGRITRCNLLACAAAVAAQKTNRPVRINMDLVAQMTMLGWRDPYYTTYEVGFDDDGKLGAVKVQIFADAGYVANEVSNGAAAASMKSVYHSPAWAIRSRAVTTDTTANTWCRTPGTINGIAIIENIIEHIAAYLSKDPLEVREINLSPDQKPEHEGPNLFKHSILPLLRETAAVQLRKQQVVEFNKANRWRKRGLSVLPLRYNYYYPPFRYTAQVVIYEHDGSVAITHGGIEMGQGINTKAAQVAASILGVPLTLLKMKPSSSLSSANSSVTGGSFGTDLVCHGVKVCCERLKGRIDVVKKMMNPDTDWPALIRTCMRMDVDLSERYWTAVAEQPPGYVIWAGGCVETELDVLTGQYKMRRADIIEDAGRSLSPFVDIGQVEGAFIMGVGNFTSETLEYDPTTGQKLVTGTWDYKPPTALDIPEDFRVTMLPNTPNPHGVLNSKATGEPPQCLSYAVVTALREAITAARADACVTGWFNIPVPVTVEIAQQLCLVKPEQFLLGTPAH